MNYKTKKIFIRVISAMLGLIIAVMALSFDPIKAEAATPFEEFPYSYRAKLKELKNMHPNWTFVAFNTNLDWNEVVKEERKGSRSLVYYNVQESWISKDKDDYKDGKLKVYDNGNWYRASQEAVEYHLNPVNYFDEKHIFAFEKLNYDPSIHTLDGTEAMISDSWMAENYLEDQNPPNIRYCNAILQAAIESGASPYHLATRIIQEQGRGDVKNKTNRNKPLISGEYGVYNYFNIGATGTKNEIITNGVRRAQNEGWDTRFKSIIGGAKIIGNQYINKGQNTVYLEKFDVDSTYSGLYSHQYQQNLQAPMSEGGMIYSGYYKANLLDSDFVFIIPVYKNMPNSEPPVNEEKVREFVRRLYSLCLDREPDEAGIDSWTELLVNREMTGTEVASGFIFSDEFKNKNYCNSCYVKQLYKAFLNREYDDAGLQVWTDILASGKNREYVFNGFVLSEEFKGICADYGIEYGNGINDNVPGTMPNGDCQGCGAKDNTVQFVTRLYNVCLDRDPDEAGLETHCSLLRSHTCSCSEIAYGFIFSEEFINKGFDDATYVEYLYRALMDREADEGGRDFWVGQMAQGASREDIFNGIVLSDEFTNLCNKYGLRR